VGLTPWRRSPLAGAAGTDRATTTVRRAPTTDPLFTPDRLPATVTPDRWRAMLPAPVRRLPADLAAVAAFVLATVGAVLLPVVSETPLRIVLGLPFVLFVPGYALVAALFPERGPDRAGTERDDAGSATGDGDDAGSATGDGDDAAPHAADEGGIDGIERVALSFGTSIAVVPLIGLVLNFTPFGIRLVPIVASLSAFTLGATAVAAQRRWSLPPGDRFRVPYREWLRAGRSELFEPEDRTDAALNVLLAASVLLAVGSVGYAVAVPKQGEAFTELYLLTETDDGELVADDYPTEFVRGEAQSLVVGIGNQEHEPVNYTVVVELQRVEVRTVSNGTDGPPGGGAGTGDATATATPVNRTVVEVLEERRVTTFRTRLEHNRTWQLRHEVAPRMTGERLRLAYLLYEGPAPPEPTVDNAYREVHLWVNVSEPGAGTGNASAVRAGASAVRPEASTVRPGPSTGPSLGRSAVAG
jgi:uncharacterized membrane protein